MKKERLDVLLVQKGLCATLDIAQRMILSGYVFVNQERMQHVGTKIKIDSSIELKLKNLKYVSRGGLKLEEALRVFPVHMEDRVMLDIGASTGGFTDCALQRGAKRVYSIDVGYGQLAWKLRQDPRVIVMERTNFRYLKKEDLTGEPPNLATIDVSFISLSLIFPKLRELLLPNGEVVSLVKPQFEAERHQVGNRGIVRDKHIHQQVLERFVQIVQSNGFTAFQLAPSPIQGNEGNIEFLAYCKFQYEKEQIDLHIEEIVQQAHERFSLKHSEEIDYGC
ncbi:TlyA family RNA methyltransferase [Laceyella sediminis]|uniref:TlyA family RNA methyltransferase n=1 Tax=Laceyella sediminis TaxID=573074 RepID=UPI000D081698|nr:TlyA family RNA methyltransferase [Laceyella sediminis]